LLLLDETQETRDILTDYLVNFENTPDRMNPWMLHQLLVSPREIYSLRRSITEHTGKPFYGASSVLKVWPHDSPGHDKSYDQGSVEFEESVQNPHILGYHGECPLQCHATHGWPSKDAWLAPRSSVFSTTEYAPNLPTQFHAESFKLKPHELSTALYDDDNWLRPRDEGGSQRGLANCDLIVR
jgi:hypothetical protein